MADDVEGLTFQELADDPGPENRQATHHVCQLVPTGISPLQGAARRAREGGGREREDPA